MDWLSGRNAFSFESMVPKEDPIRYWTYFSPAAPELAAVCVALLQIVGHEGSVERTFSHQKLVQAPLRASLAPEAVQAQICIRFNGPLLKNRTNNC